MMKRILDRIIDIDYNFIIGRGKKEWELRENNLTLGLREATQVLRVLLLYGKASTQRTEKLTNYLCLAQNKDFGWGTFPRNQKSKIGFTGDIIQLLIWESVLKKIEIGRNYIISGIEFLLKNQEYLGHWKGDVTEDGERQGDMDTSRFAAIALQYSIYRNKYKPYPQIELIRNAYKKFNSFLIEKQNSNGSWSEMNKKRQLVIVTCDVLRVAVGEKSNAKVVNKGIQYLLKTQRRDGTWDTIHRKRKSWDLDHTIDATRSLVFSLPLCEERIKDEVRAAIIKSTSWILKAWNLDRIRRYELSDFNLLIRTCKVLTTLLTVRKAIFQKYDIENF